MRSKIVLFFMILTILISSIPADASRLAEDKGKEVKLDAGQKKKLNTFFSNFAETYLEFFAEGKIKNEELIRFGILHNSINKPANIKKVDNYYGVLAEKDVETAAKKYFGEIKITNKSIQDYEYSKGNYKIPYADGEAYNFSQIEKLIDISDNYYIAYLNNYIASPGFTGDPHAAIDKLKKGEDTPELKDKIKAVIKKVEDGGQSRYILIEYLKNQL